MGRGARWKERTTRSSSFRSQACTQPRLAVQTRWLGVQRSREPSENLSSTISLRPVTMYRVGLVAVMRSCGSCLAVTSLV